MIRKLMCWLGLHEWIPEKHIFLDNGKYYCSHYAKNKNCGECDFCKQVCKHCGKIKKS